MKQQTLRQRRAQRQIFSALAKQKKDARDMDADRLWLVVNYSDALAENAHARVNSLKARVSDLEEEMFYLSNSVV